MLKNQEVFGDYGGCLLFSCLTETELCVCVCAVGT